MTKNIASALITAALIAAQGMAPSVAPASDFAAAQKQWRVRALELSASAVGLSPTTNDCGKTRALGGRFEAAAKAPAPVSEPASPESRGGRCL